MFQAVARIFRNLQWTYIEELLEHKYHPSNYTSDKGKYSVYKNCIGFMVTNWADFDAKLKILIDEMKTKKSEDNRTKGNRFRYNV